MASELEVGKVNINSADGVLQMGSTAANGSPSLKLCEQVSSGDISNGFSFNVDGDGTNNLHIKRHVVSASGTDAMVIDRDTGHVNIGTGTAQKLLTLQGNDAAIRLLDTSGTNQFASLSSEGGVTKITSRNNTSHGSFVFQSYNGTAVLERASISATGLASFSNGIKSEKGILSGTVLIADDAVTTITPARKGGFMKLIVDSATAEAGEYPQDHLSGEVFFDCGTSLHIAKNTGMSSNNLDVSTSDVSGSTGTDGNVTIAVQAGVIKIENRSNGQKRFNYFLYC